MAAHTAPADDVALVDYRVVEIECRRALDGIEVDAPTFKHRGRRVACSSCRQS